MTNSGDDAPHSDRPEIRDRALWLEDPVLRRERLRSQVEIIRSSLPGVGVFSGESDDFGDMRYMYRTGTILVRDADLARVAALVPGEVQASLINGLTAYKPTRDDTLAALAAVDAAHGVGVATPDHVLYVTPAGCCPATEPEIPPQDNPDPDVRRDAQCDGTGVRVSVVDTGFIPELVNGRHPWLEGVTGDVEDYNANDIGPYIGHGTFIAGIVRCMAPACEVHVEGFLTHGGAIFESDMITQLDQALDRVPDIISLSAGTTSRNNLDLLGFEVFWENRLKHYKGTVLVGAAGNDGDRGPFWPAAFPWAISVGALNLDGERAKFSNFGSWVDVYARGVDMINAYPNGTYRYHEPPPRQAATFTREMAMWSGTSFSTPLVAGMIAARMSCTGESGRLAADALLRIARAHARPHVGAVLEPDDVAIR